VIEYFGGGAILRRRQEAVKNFVLPGVPEERGVYKIADDKGRDGLCIRIAYLEAAVRMDHDTMFERSQAFLQACVLRRCVTDGQIDEATAAEAVLDGLASQPYNDELWFSLHIHAASRNLIGSATVADTVRIAVLETSENVTRQITDLGGMLFTFPMP